MSIDAEHADPARVMADPPTVQEPLSHAQFAQLRGDVSVIVPSTELLLEIAVDTGPREDLGVGPYGERRIIAILGGRFIGLGMQGVVVPGGADRQIVRHNGVRDLEAIYELRADDGTVLSVVNRVVIDETVPGERYARSVVKITAPEGPHEWLNRRVMVGTLTPLSPARHGVLIRVFAVN